MNHVVTSKDAILARSRRLVQQQGWKALNIRSVAAVCSISVGSVYHYFSSKSELMEAIIESVWQDVLHLPQQEGEAAGFREQIALLFERLAEGERRYPGFFSLHSMGFLGEDRAFGQHRMAQTWTHIQVQLRNLLREDPRVRPGALEGELTPEVLAELVFSQMLAALLRREYDCAPLLALIDRALY